ncbi:MAG TPA: POTRA domain-containing protein [Candidatus Polarisedimenticolia bacterium]|nr:POTRA domain-containing protein [Candidatus Polarisedimenticolia bacterium]
MSSFMRFMRRFLLVLVCLLPALAGAADRFNLARVLVSGSQRYREDDLVRATGLIVNTQVTAGDLQNAANRLGNSGAFSSVQFLFKPAIGTKGVEADFQVADAEKYLPALFENFAWFSDQELQEAVHQAVPLYHGELPTSGNMSDEVSAALSKFLASKGLPSQISYILSASFGQLPTAYKFRVADADLKVSEVTLVGAAHMLPEPLAKALSPLKGTIYLLSDVAIVLEKNLVPIYRQHGYLQFKIAEIKPTVEAKDLVSIEVTVSEGEQYRLTGFSWSGNTLIPGDNLSKRMSLKAGNPVDEPQLDRDLAQVRKLYGKFGREAVMIKPVPSFADNTVSYTFQVTEGDLYHMGKLEIQGIEPEQAHKLERIWKLAEGEPYDATYVQKFMANTLVRVPGHKWTWMMFEQIDDTQKTVNVRLQIKIE